MDRFVLRQIVELFFIGVIIFTSIIFASDTFVSLIKQISTYGMQLHIAFMIILLNLPGVIVMTIPMSVLFSTVMTVNKMCLQSEITVLKACGIGLRRISKPIFIFSFTMAIATFVINETIVPETMAQSKMLALYSMAQRNIPDGKRNFTIKELTQGNSLKRLFYVEECRNQKFSNVTLLDLSDSNKIQIVETQSGTSVQEGWQFDKASTYDIVKKEKTFHYSWAEKTIVSSLGSNDIQRQLNKKNDGSDCNILELMPYAFEKLFNKLKELMPNQLGKITKDKDLAPDVINKYKMKFWEKLALPITAIVFVLIGIPLAITPPRVRHNRGFLFSIGIIFVYYVIRALSMSLGYNGVLVPFLAANMPNIIIGIAGYFMYVNKAEKI